MVVSSGAAILNSWKLNIVLTELIKTQVFESLVMFGGGMVVAILYQLFTRKFKIYIKNNVLAGACELLFWFFAGALASQFLYYCAYGAISVHVVCSFICGVFLWNCLFCAIIPVGDDECLNKRKKEAGNSKPQIK